jgi:hypothetical protein
MKSALTIWLIWRDLLVRSGMASSRSACVSLRNASFHIDWQGELGFVSFYSSAGETSRDSINLFCTFGFGGLRISALYEKTICAAPIQETLRQRIRGTVAVVEGNAYKMTKLGNLA